MGRIMLLGMEEILGTDGLNAVLNLAGCPHWSESIPAGRHCAWNLPSQT